MGTYNKSDVVWIFFKAIMEPNEFFMLPNNLKAAFLERRVPCFGVDRKLNLVLFTESIRNVDNKGVVAQIYGFSFGNLR